MVRDRPDRTEPARRGAKPCLNPVIPLPHNHTIAGDVDRDFLLGHKLTGPREGLDRAEHARR